MIISRKSIVVIVVVVLALTLGGIALFLLRNQSQQTTPPVSQQRCEALSDKSVFEQKINENVSKESGLHYTVTSVQNPANCWYITTGTLVKGADSTLTVFEQTKDNKLNIITGPGTSLSEDALKSSGAPDVVLWNLDRGNT